ncbi:MAG: hypothetical protein OXU81_10335, partial [Gammaproteobacteria bacterium]|nr:hypothetical protein [Gammaproteobacteria bacterium]
MDVFRMGGGEKHRGTAPRAGRDTGPGLRKIAGPGRSAGPGMHPRGNLRAAPRGFRSGQRGATTIVAGIALLILITALAALLGIVHETYLEDRMGRSARPALRPRHPGGGGDRARDRSRRPARHRGGRLRGAL